MENSRLRKISLWIASSIVIVTIILIVLVYFRVFKLHILIGEFNLHHWFSWTGVLFIAFFTPVYYLLKRHYPTKIKALLAIHVFGNLTSVMLVSMHFIQEMSRPPQSFPELGTGLIVLYPAMILLTATGFFLRFRGARNPTRQLRFIHTSIAVTFYFVILVHVLHGLEII